MVRASVQDLRAFPDLTGLALGPSQVEQACRLAVPVARSLPDIEGLAEEGHGLAARPSPR